MTGKQISRMNWIERRGCLEGARLAVLCAMSPDRALTTREIADASGIDILTVRPRVTELCQLGFAACTGKRGHEGTYCRVIMQEAECAYLRSRSLQEEFSYE